MTPRPSRLAGGRLRAMSIAAALLLIGCSPTPPVVSPSPSPTVSSGPTASPTPLTSDALAAIYSEINGQVQAIRGLEEKDSVVPVVVSQAEVGDLLREQISTQMPPDIEAAYERLYQAMGLLPAGASLDNVFAELLESQVAGTYIPKEKKLYVVSKSGALGPFERSIYAHEYEHALQDQHFDLGSHDAQIKDNSDRGLAWQSIFEGDAYTLQTFWMLQELTPFELVDIMGQAQDPEAMAALGRIPPIVAAQVLFAATQGTSWVSQVYAQGGWPAVDDAFRNPPVSTEQILHADKWAAREAPIAVSLPADLLGRLGQGWTKALEDTWGEQQFSVWLTGRVEIAPSLTPPEPPAAVAGWGGDRLAVFEGPGEQWAVVMKTQWDTASDAAEFEAAFEPLLAKAGGSGRMLPGEGGAVRWIVIGSDDAILQAMAGALGLAG